MNQPVTRDMTIGNIVEKYPQTAEVLLGFGLQCVGCAVNPYETLEQGAVGHGMSEESLQTLLEEVNLVVTKKPSYELNPAGITLSPNAIDTLQAMIEADGKEGFGLKVEATKTGDALDYYLDLVAEPEGEERAMEWEGVTMFVSPATLELMNPSVIDYQVLPTGEGFKIVSLKEEELCPCNKPMSQCNCKGEKGGKGCCGGNCGC